MSQGLSFTEHGSEASGPYGRESVLHAFLMQAPAAIAILEGPSQVFVFANEKYQQVFGRSADELTGKTVLQAFPEAAGQGFYELIAEVYSECKQLNFAELPATLAIDGITATRYYDTQLKAIAGADNICVQIMIMIVDVTEKVRARVSLQASEERYQHFIRQSTEGIWRCELDEPVSTSLPVQQQIEEFFRLGYMAECNDAMAKMYGYEKREELTGLRLRDFFPDTEETGAYLSYFIQSGYHAENAESAELDRNGSIRYFSNNLIGVVENGFLVRAWGTQRDITDQRVADEKLRESEMRFRSLAEAMPQVVWVAKASGEVIYYNEQVQHFDGVHRNNDGTWIWNSMVHQDDIEPTLKAWAHAVATGTVYEAEQRVRMKDGHYRWHLSRALPQRNEKGEIISWYGTATDIHDQKDAAEKLEQLVTERTLELKRSNEDLQQFAHVASHDLKEPVRKVMTFANRIKIEFGDVLPLAANSYLAKVESASIRMYAMIDGVLLYSSLNALEQSKETIDLEELIDTIRTDLEVSITRLGAVIRCDSLPSIEGSSILVYQLFYNLLNNSLKFVKNGRAPQILVSGSHASAEEVARRGLPSNTLFTRIIVKDNGIGFSSGEAERIFNAFTRLNAKDKFEGTGLGLSLCRKIVERHGGAIWAEGREGEGARFVMLWPL